MNIAVASCCSRAASSGKPRRLVAIVPPSQDVVLTRTIRAPLERVFRSWTTPTALARWWSPRPVPARHSQLHVSPGGAYRVCIRTHDGDDHWVRGIYHSVDAPRQLSFSWTWEDDATNPASLVMVSFARKGNDTSILLCHTGFASPRTRAAHQAGWIECFDRLQALLASAGSPLN